MERSEGGGEATEDGRATAGTAFTVESTLTHAKAQHWKTNTREPRAHVTSGNTEK